MLSIILLITAQLFGLNASADPVTPAVANKPLFTAHEVLNLSLSVDFDTMCRPNEVEDCRYTPTTLTYTAADGVEHSIPVEIRVRGGWRARQTHCKVPPRCLCDFRLSKQRVHRSPGRTCCH